MYNEIRALVKKEEKQYPDFEVKALMTIKNDIDI